jgi:hypothetical protein
VQVSSYVEVELTSQGVTSTTEDYAKLQEKFYESYNPDVGFHTAVVLGGILSLLVCYLLYKTKVKVVCYLLYKTKVKGSE